MLIFISDMHLTDQTLAPSVPPEAVKLLTQKIKEIANTSKSKKIELILLGDIFDVLRSRHWLDERSGNERPKRERIGPWQLADGGGVGRVLTNVFNGIKKHYRKYFKDLSEHERIELTWVPGNHDRLVATSKEGKDFLEDIGVNWDGNYELERPDYGVFACHGHRFDKYNFLKEYQYPALGEAVVVDFLNKFQYEVCIRSGAPYFDHNEIVFLGAMEYVRPLYEIPFWIHEKSKTHAHPLMPTWIHRAWEAVVNNFLENEFLEIKYYKKENILKVTLESLFGKLVHKPFGFLEIIKKINLHPSTEDQKKEFQHTLDKEFINYKSCAEKEPILNDRSFRYVIYGHTHNETKKPVPISDGKFYINTGWWKRCYKNDKPFMEHFNIVVFYPGGNKLPDIYPVMVNKEIPWQDPFREPLERPETSFERAQEEKRPWEQMAFLERGLLDRFGDDLGIKVMCLPNPTERGFDMVVDNEIKQPEFGSNVAVGIKRKIRIHDITRLANKVEEDAEVDRGWMFTLQKVSNKLKENAYKDSNIIVFDRDDINRFRKGENFASLAGSLEIPSMKF